VEIKCVRATSKAEQNRTQPNSRSQGGVALGEKVLPYVLDPYTLYTFIGDSEVLVRFAAVKQGVTLSKIFFVLPFGFLTFQKGYVLSTFQKLLENIPTRF